MTSSTKSLLMLVGMLMLGAALGAAATAALRPGPPGPPPSREGSSGFVEHMERTIQPRDAAQRAEIRPVLEATDRRNRDVVDASRRAMRENLDSMMAGLSPVLEPSQRERLAELIRTLRNRPPRDGPPPPR